MAELVISLKTLDLVDTELLFTPIRKLMFEAIGPQEDDFEFLFETPALIDKYALDAALENLASAEFDIYSGGERVARVSYSQVHLNHVNGKLSPFRDRVNAEDFGIFPIFTTADLPEAERLLRGMVNKKLIADGVRIVGMDTVFVAPFAKIGKGTTIFPGTIIRDGCEIGEECEIGPNAMLNKAKIGDRTVVNSSQINESTLGSNCVVGPFAFIRPHCVIGNSARIGDFVELKNSNIGNETKVSHLTYVGDSDVGNRVNFGCGTVTVNYDGQKKHRTTIHDGVFIGCNSNLVAPVTIGEGAYTAAGTTVTKDVPPDAFAIGRVKQENKENYVLRLKQRLKSRDPVIYIDTTQ